MEDSLPPPPPGPSKSLHLLLVIGGAIWLLGLGVAIGLLAARFSSQSQPTPTPTGQYVCPENGWVNCMPILTPQAKKTCTQEALAWYRLNCPNFQGVAQ